MTLFNFDHSAISLAVLMRQIPLPSYNPSFLPLRPRTPAPSTWSKAVGTAHAVL